MNEQVQAIEAEVVEITALQEMEKAAVDIQISTAKQYPRVISRVREKVLELATVDQLTAASCHYAKPVGGKKVVGPSIRMAEIVVAAYGNLRSKAYLAEESHRTIKCRAECWDLESNSASAIEVTRSIMDKHGQRYKDHVVVNTINAGLSIAYRNAVFKIVPMSLFNSETHQIKQVAAGEGLTLQEQAKKCLEAFKEFKINKDEFLKVANLRKIDDITIDDIIGMRGTYSQLKDGLITKEELLFDKKMSDLNEPKVTNEEPVSADPSKQEKSGKENKPPGDFEDF